MNTKKHLRTPLVAASAISNSVRIIIIIITIIIIPRWLLLLMLFLLLTTQSLLSSEKELVAEVEDDVEHSILIVHYQSFVSETLVDVAIVSAVIKAVLHLELVAVLVLVGVVTFVVDVLIAERFVLFHLAAFLASTFSTNWCD